MDFSKLSLKQLIDLLQEKKITSEQLTSYYIDRIKKFQHKNAVLEVFDDALDQARKCDEFAKTHDKLPILHGVPILLKDNMCFKGHKLSCSSKFLEGFVSPYDATITERMKNAGAVILGRTNMDEFAMGSSTENSAFGVTLNALDDKRVSGGSSGGSACAMALGLAAITLGSDTGGSIRQPASLNGVVGLKPTYGRVSRYGLVAFGSSIDQIGPISKTVEDTAILMNVISGYDKNDRTTINVPVGDMTEFLGTNVSGKTIGVPKQILEVLKTTKYEQKYREAFNKLTNCGMTIKEVDIPHLDLCLPIYYIINPAEAASNYGRFDGIKYTNRDDSAYKIDEVYTLSRTKFFGNEVKRRIMLGNFVLSSGYYDAYYGKAKALQQLVTNEVKKALDGCDALMLPTTYDEAFLVGQKVNDHVAMYAEDMFTVFANLTGVPAISVPFSKGENGLPISLQIVGRHFDEPRLLGIADFVEKCFKENDHE